MITKFGMRDADLVKTKALPAAASTSVVTDGIDIGPNASFRAVRDVDRMEMSLEVPALSAVILPDTKTCTLTIESDTDPNFGSPTTLGTLVLTGAGGAGAPNGGELRVTPTRTGEQYVRGKVAFGANTTDGSALKATFALNF